MSFVLNERQYREIKAIQWNNRWTDRIRRDMHEPKACIGWDAEQGVWLFAFLVRTAVKRAYGTRGAVEYEDVPVVWDQWRGAATPEHPDGVPRSIEPYAEVLERWRWCDKANAQSTSEYNLEQAIAKASEEADRARFRSDFTSEMRKPIAKLAEQSGVTYHRPTGPDVQRVSSANLWRRGAGA